MIRQAYTAAGTLPAKVIQNPHVQDSLRRGSIVPIHVQFSPTNRCNQACSFCNCRNVDRDREMPLADVVHMLDTFQSLGTRAITVTGGGDPLMHNGINGILQSILDHGMQIGLITNGLLLDVVPDSLLNRVTWCRISGSDERKWNTRLGSFLHRAVTRAPSVGWAFSYIVTDPDIDNIASYLQFAFAHGFTNVRIADELLNVDTAPSMPALRDRVLSATSIGDSIAIYQDRKRYEPGSPSCLVGLLRPQVCPSGGVYPCCSVQFAQSTSDLRYTAKMRMGRVADAADIWGSQRPFDGRKCSRCYFSAYNDLLNCFKMPPLPHGDFV